MHAVGPELPDTAETKRQTRNVQEPSVDRGTAGQCPAPRGAAHDGRELCGLPQTSRILRGHRDHARRQAEDYGGAGGAELPDHPQLALPQRIFTQNATNASKWSARAPCVRVTSSTAHVFARLFTGSDGLVEAESWSQESFIPLPLEPLFELDVT